MPYDRYRRFRVNGIVNIPPTFVIPPKSTDYFEVYRNGMSRLDLISYDYYGDAGYDWLILMANPSVPQLEYMIPDGTELRIPYPLDTTLEYYNSQIEKYEFLYGLNT